MTSFHLQASSSGSVATPAFCFASSTTWSNSAAGMSLPRATPCRSGYMSRTEVIVLLIVGDSARSIANACVVVVTCLLSL